MHEQLSTCSEITYRLHVGVTRQRDDVAGTKETIPKSSVRSRPAADVVATAVGQPTHPAAKGTVSILDIYFRCGDDNLVWFKVFVVFLL